MNTVKYSGEVFTGILLEPDLKKAAIFTEYIVRLLLSGWVDEISC